MSFTMLATAGSMRFCSSWMWVYWLSLFAWMVAFDSVTFVFLPASLSPACVDLLGCCHLPSWRSLGRRHDAGSHPWLTGAVGPALLSSPMVLACVAVSMALGARMFTPMICCFGCLAMVLKVSLAALFGDGLVVVNDACCGCAPSPGNVRRPCAIIIHWFNVEWRALSQFVGWVVVTRRVGHRAALRRPFPLAVPRKAYTSGLG